MHLTDDQLREIDNARVNASLYDAKVISDYKSQTDDVHLKKCRCCQKRLANLQAFRQHLASDTNSTLPAFEWQAITNELAPSACASSLNERVPTQLHQLNAKVERLKIALLAIAAAAIIVLAYPQFKGNTQNKLNMQLASLIKENHLLQADFAEFRQANNAQTFVYKSTEFELQEIDQQIQLSYLNNLSVEYKISLWNERKQLLIQSINSKPQQAVFII
jgi:hypothetical protein